ncbi:unnamed protein product, partial [Polarella glacialis]
VLLYEWLGAALEYAAWSRARLQDVASPARATRAPPGRAASNVVPAPLAVKPTLLAVVASGGSPTTPSPLLAASIAPPLAQPALQTASAERQTQPARSPSPKLLRRTPGSTAASADAGSAVRAAEASASRTVGFGVSWASLSSVGQDNNNHNSVYHY